VVAMCAGFVITASIFCIDNLLTQISSEDTLSLFADERIYILDIVAAIFLVVAGSLCSASGRKGWMVNALGDEQKEAKDVLGTQAEPQCAIDHSLNGDEVELQSLLDAAQNAIEVELEKKLSEAVKPMDAELQDRIDEALSPVHEDLQDIIDKALNPMGTELQNMMDEGWDSMMADLEGKLHEPLRPVKEDLQVRAATRDQHAGSDRAPSPTEMSNMPEDDGAQMEDELLGLMDAAQNAMEADLEKRFDECTEMEQDMIDDALNPIEMDLLAMVSDPLSPMYSSEDQLPDTVEFALDPLEVEVPDMVIEQASARLNERLQETVDSSSSRRVKPCAVLAKACLMVLVVVACVCMESLQVEAYIVETGCVIVSMIAGYIFFSPGRRQLHTTSTR